MGSCDTRLAWPAGRDKDTSRDEKCDRSGETYRLEGM